MTRLLAALLMIVMTLSPHAMQKKMWYDLYDEAIAHIQRAEWAQAETKLQQAKNEGPAPGRRVLRYGALRPPFFPDYYLGIVYQNTGRPKEALAAFNLARGQNIDLTNREFQQLDAYARSAQNQIASANPKTDPTPPKPDTPPGGTGTPGTTDPKPVPTPPPVDVGATLRQRFDDLLSEARAEMAKRNYAAALVSAGRARDLQIDAGRADALIQDIERANLVDQITADVDAGDLIAASSKLDRLKKIAPSGADVQRLSDAIRTAGAAVDAAARRATLERNAMRQFFAGDYQGALRLLGELEKTAALPPRAQFYRACSLATLALRADTVDAAQLTAARQAFAQSQSASSELQRHRRYISPKVLQALSGY
jgi:tetratricopeptide (TPR) repeat protein